MISRRLALLALLLPPAAALAHSELRRSVPASGAVLAAAPERFELHFNERVQVTAIRLFRDGGAEIPFPARRAIREAEAEILPAPALDPGAYRIEWRAISRDGHPVGGTIRFAVRP
jgi:methionine-rich copper-binding protein CopC